MTTPNSTSGNWQLFLLGHVNENVRKALLFNILTKRRLDAKVMVTKDEYKLVEVVDPKLNQFVEFNHKFYTKQK